MRRKRPMNDDDLLPLVRLLGYLVDDKLPGWLQRDQLEDARSRVIADPTLLFDYPPDWLGLHPSRERAQQLLDSFVLGLDQPAGAARRIEAARGKDVLSYHLPTVDRFRGYSDEIPIYMWQMDTEDADIVAWGVTAGFAAAYRLGHKRPD